MKAPLCLGQLIFLPLSDPEHTFPLSAFAPALPVIRYYTVLLWEGRLGEVCNSLESHNKSVVEPVFKLCLRALVVRDGDQQALISIRTDWVLGSRVTA